MDGQKLGEGFFEGGKASRYPVLLGSNNLLKDFESNLIGIKKTESKTFKMTFPQDYVRKKKSRARKRNLR